MTSKIRVAEGAAAYIRDTQRFSRDESLPSVANILGNYCLVVGTFEGDCFARIEELHDLVAGSLTIQLKSGVGVYLALRPPGIGKDAIEAWQDSANMPIEHTSWPALQKNYRLKLLQHLVRRVAVQVRQCSVFNYGSGEFERQDQEISRAHLIQPQADNAGNEQGELFSIYIDPAVSEGLSVIKRLEIIKENDGNPPDTRELIIQLNGTFVC